MEKARPGKVQPEDSGPEEAELERQAAEGGVGPSEWLWGPSESKGFPPICAGSLES